jgi:hypothetical protein
MFSYSLKSRLKHVNRTKPAGWVERLRTHRTVSVLLMMGIASLNPSYEFSIVIPAKAGIQ